MERESDVDALVARWSASGRYRPAPARPEGERAAFAASAKARRGVPLPDDYARFLALCDGGQYDAMVLGGVAGGDAVLERTEELDAFPALVIGGSGNVDSYLLGPDGRCEVVSFFDLGQVFESYPSFTAFLRQLMTRSESRR